MITLKIPYTSDYDFTELRKQYSNVLRFSYNRFKEGLKFKEIYHSVKTLENVKLPSIIVGCAILEAEGIHKKNPDKTIYFGGKKNFQDRLKGKISKEQFQEKRLSNLYIMGTCRNKGNLHFNLDIQSNTIIFKLNRKEHYTLKLPSLKKSYKKYLEKLQKLNTVKAKELGYTYSVKISSKHIYIMFEEFKTETQTQLKLNENKYIGIDLNPAHIGISVLDKCNVIHTQEFDLSKLIENIKSFKGSSSCKKTKRLNNKLNFETIEISKKISQLAHYHKVKNVFIEDLNFKNNVKGFKAFNRLTKNLWKREKFIQNLQKRLNILGITLTFVNPAYSSVIGNLQYNYSDPVNASIEIARRGFQAYYKKIKDSFYPKLEVKDLWKEYLTSNGIKSWKELSKELKNSKMKYRVSLLNEVHLFKVFEQTSHKSMVNFYTFKNQLSC